MAKRTLLSIAFAIIAGLSFAASGADRMVETMPPLPEGAFTFAVIPDTQDYDGEGWHTKRGRKPGTGPVRNEKFDAIVDWLAANAKKENILFVTHTGDIVDMNNDFQWRFAIRGRSVSSLSDRRADVHRHALYHTEFGPAWQYEAEVSGNCILKSEVTHSWMLYRGFRHGNGDRSYAWNCAASSATTRVVRTVSSLPETAWIKSRLRRRLWISWTTASVS